MFIRVVTVSRMENLGSIIHREIREIRESGEGTRPSSANVADEAPAWSQRSNPEPLNIELQDGGRGH